MTVPEYEYNNKTVTKPELECLGDYISTRHVRSILEFGSGISSHYFGTMAEVVSLEDNPHWIVETENLKTKFGPSNYRVVLWSGTDQLPPCGMLKPDMIFIDGPVDTAMGHYGRSGAFMAARNLIDSGACRAVWMHDAWEHHCIDLAVRHLAPVCLQRAYPFWPHPNPHFLGASMLLWEVPR